MGLYRWQGLWVLAIQKAGSFSLYNLANTQAKFYWTEEDTTALNNEHRDFKSLFILEKGKYVILFPN